MYRKPAAGRRKPEKKKASRPRLARKDITRYGSPCSSSCSSVLHRTRHLILHDIDFDSSPSTGLPQVSIAAGRGSISHAHHINTVDRYVMVQHQVTHHGIRHLPRTCNRSRAMTRGETAHFNNVA